MQELGLLPTPVKASGDQGGNFGNGSPTLAGAIRDLLPTPTVHGNNNRKGLSAASGDGLATVVRSLLPTPIASDGVKDPRSSEATFSKGGRPLREHVERLLPTPVAMTGEYSAGGAGQRAQLRDLGLLPTPVKGNSGSNRSPSDKAPRPSLATTVRRTISPKGSPRSSAPRGRSAWAGVRALLAITEWLLGFEPGWLASAFPPTATASSRTSPNSSE